MAERIINSGDEGSTDGPNFSAPETGRPNSTEATPPEAGTRSPTPDFAVGAKAVNQDANEIRQNLDEAIKVQREAAEAKAAGETRTEKIGRLNQLDKVLEAGPRNPQELVDLVNSLSYQELRQLEQDRKYGQGKIGKFKAWLSGEFDFKLDEKGQLAHQALNEAGRKAISTIFNKRTIASAAAFTAMGIITGGVGWASGGVLLGSVAGRFSAEALDFAKGTTREARRELLLAEQERWGILRAKADRFNSLRESDPVEANKFLSEIADIYYRQGEASVIKQISLAEKQQNFDQKLANHQKWCNRLQTIGELVGGVAGLAYSVNAGHVEKIDTDLWNGIKDQSTFHEVAKQGGVWNFLYTRAGEATAAQAMGATVSQGGAFGMHALGASNAFGIVSAAILERQVPVLAASLLAWQFEGGSAKAKQAEKNRQGQIKQNQYRELGKQIPNARAYLEQVAQNHGNRIPESPANLSFDWFRQSPILKKDFDLSHLPTWWQLDQNRQPIVDSNGRFARIGIAGVDVENNRIAIVQSIEEAQTGAAGYPITIMRLDDFLSRYQEIVTDKDGQPVTTQVSQANQPEPTTTTPPDSSRPDHRSSPTLELEPTTTSQTPKPTAEAENEDPPSHSPASEAVQNKVRKSVEIPNDDIEAERRQQVRQDYQLARTEFSHVLDFVNKLKAETRAKLGVRVVDSPSIKDGDRIVVGPRHSLFFTDENGALWEHVLEETPGGQPSYIVKRHDKGSPQEVISGKDSQDIRFREQNVGISSVLSPGTRYSRQLFNYIKTKADASFPATKPSSTAAEVSQAPEPEKVETASQVDIRQWDWEKPEAQGILRQFKLADTSDEERSKLVVTVAESRQAEQNGNKNTIFTLKNNLNDEVANTDANSLAAEGIKI